MYAQSRYLSAWAFTSGPSTLAILLDRVSFTEITEARAAFCWRGGADFRPSFLAAPAETCELPDSETPPALDVGVTSPPSAFALLCRLRPDAATIGPSTLLTVDLLDRDATDIL